MGLSTKKGRQEEGGMLTKLQKVKESLLVTILNVALPTADILTDLMSITKFYIGTETHTDCDEKSELIPFVEIYNYNLLSLPVPYSGLKSKESASTPAQRMGCTTTGTQCGQLPFSCRS